MTALLLPLAAIAQSDDIIAATVGNYTVLPADGKPGCGLRLGRDKTIGGRSATPAADCAQRIPLLADVSAWYLADGSTRLIDPTRKLVMSFEEDETALPSSPNVANPAYYMVPARAGVDHVPRPAELTGTWRLARGKGAPCLLRFERKAPDAKAAQPLTIDGSCRLAGLPPKLGRWRIEAIHLLIEGEDDGLVLIQTGKERFESQDGKFTLAR